MPSTRPHPDGASAFVSYSGRRPEDKDFAKRLLVRLGETGIDAWVYERRGHHVPSGARVDEYCEQKIRHADIFIAIVSESSLGSEFTRAEVAVALDHFERGSIIAVVTATAAPGDWPDSYARLAKHKYLRARLSIEHDLERCLEDICQQSGVPYEPEADAIPRLPLVRRLTEELRAIGPSDPQYEVGTFSELRQIARDIVLFHRNGQITKALDAHQGLLYRLERDFDGAVFFYPRLVKGVLEAEYAKVVPAYLERAWVTFQEVVREGRQSPFFDENAYAALAWVEMQRGRHPEALRWYSQAQALLELQGRTDADLVHNLLIAAIAAGAPLDLQRVADLLGLERPGHLTKDPDLFERIALLFALGCAYCGEPEKAEAALAQLDVGRRHVQDLVVRLAEELFDRTRGLGKKRIETLAIQLLRGVLSRCGDDDCHEIALILAALHYRRGEPDQALEVLEPLVGGECRDTKVVVEAALCATAAGRREKADDLCRKAAAIRLPGSRWDAKGTRQFLYYRGLAKWLLGRSELARADFLDSAYGGDSWYELVTREQGVVIGKAPSQDECTGYPDV